MTTEQNRRLPAKSVCSKVAPEFYAGIVEELEPHYEVVDEVCARLHDRITPATNNTLKTDVLHHTVDIYVRKAIATTPFVEILTVLSQLCRECDSFVCDTLEYDEMVFFVDEATLKYKVYNAITHCVPKLIQECIVSKSTASNPLTATEDFDGAYGVELVGKSNKCVITPYSICTQYQTPLRRSSKNYTTVYTNIAGSSYTEDVKRYFLGQVDELLSVEYA